MMRAFAAMIFALAVAVLPAGAATAGADSTQRAVAAFIASNFKLAMAQAMGDLTSQGLTLDSAAVMDMVRADLATPYDRAEHTDGKRYNHRQFELARRWYSRRSKQQRECEIGSRLGLPCVAALSAPGGLLAGGDDQTCRRIGTPGQHGVGRGAGIEPFNRAHSLMASVRESSSLTVIFTDTVSEGRAAATRSGHSMRHTAPESK